MLIHSYVAKMIKQFLADSIDCYLHFIWCNNDGFELRPSHSIICTFFGSLEGERTGENKRGEIEDK